MTVLYSPRYVFRDGQDPSAYQVFCGEESEIIHERCAKAPEDRELPLYADDIEAMRNREPIQCFMCYEQIADVIDKTEAGLLESVAPIRPIATKLNIGDSDHDRRKY